MRQFITDIHFFSKHSRSSFNYILH